MEGEGLVSACRGATFKPLRLEHVHASESERSKTSGPFHRGHVHLIELESAPSARIRYSCRSNCRGGRCVYVAGWGRGSVRIG